MKQQGQGWSLVLCCLLIPWMTAHGGTLTQSTQVVLSSTPLLPPTTAFLSTLPDPVRLKIKNLVMSGQPVLTRVSEEALLP